MWQGQIVPVWKVEVRGGKTVNAIYFAETPHEVFGDLLSHLDGVWTLEEGEEPVTITIAGGGFETVRMAISRQRMSQRELKALPDFSAY